jgi:hypothetical protein
MTRRGAMRIEVVEGLAVEAREAEAQGGETGLGIYCTRCGSGIVMVVTPREILPESEFGWQSDEDVLLAIRMHLKRHEPGPG